MKTKLNIFSAITLTACLIGNANANNSLNQIIDDIIEIINNSNTTRVIERNTYAQLPDALTDEDFFAYDADQVQLGNLLFYDKILSGNMNISCATCHHGLTATGDGLSLSIGEGGNGIGMSRDTGYDVDAVHERVPRNAPHVFNAGAKSMTTMFYDGRVTADPSQPSGFISPAGLNLPSGLDNALAAQAMFPVTSATEMAGQAGENPVADAVVDGNLAGTNGVWDLLSQRIQNNATYSTMFIEAYDDVNQASDINFVHVANALAAFEAVIWRADNSPFDQFLRGDKKALSANQIEGMNLFYGDAGCSGCHTGPFLDGNNDFKSIGMIQVGPGKGDNQAGYDDGLDDFGRERVTGDTADRYKFRVLTARNTLLTGPWGHGGAYDNLTDLIKHHLNPAVAWENYDHNQLKLPTRVDLDEKDLTVFSNPTRSAAIIASAEVTPTELSGQQINRLIDFLSATTDIKSMNLRNEVPQTVPSGLPIFD